MAMNESLFRRANEKLDEARAGAAFVDYMCECGDEKCALPLRLAQFEYEEVRRVSTHFVVVPGHVDQAFERVVRETPRFQVVEKTRLGAEIARQLDPRR
jgi:hypothetical protein